MLVTRSKYLVSSTFVRLYISSLYIAGFQLKIYILGEVSTSVEQAFSQCLRVLCDILIPRQFEQLSRFDGARQERDLLTELTSCAQKKERETDRERERERERENLRNYSLSELLRGR